jgi:hypothetical protein
VVEFFCNFNVSKPTYMKTKYFTFPVLLFLAIDGQAQLTLTKATNEPVSGDTQSMLSCDSTTAVPRNKGTGKSWNFSSFTSSSFTEVTTYTTTASVPESSLFPGATLAMLRGTNNKEFYISSGSDWLFKGDYETQSGDFMLLNDPALFMKWPVSMSSTFSDVASGTEVSGSSSTAVTATLMYEATGTGTVTLPGGAVHNNCLQITSTLVVITGTGTGAVTSTQLTYRYYSSTRKFHIAEIQYNSESGSTEFSAYFDAGSVAVGLNEASATSKFTLYPNPSSDLVYINLPHGITSARIEIRDTGGRLVLESEYNGGIKISGLPPGIYSVSLKSDKFIGTKRLIISR